MANDLNFDELDQAVNSYMKKGPPSQPAPPADPPVTPPSTAMPVSSTPPTTPVATPPTPALTPASQSAASRVQLRPRQTLAGRRAGGTTTFHDIMPAHRRAAVSAPTKPAMPSRVAVDIQPPTLTAPPKPPAAAPLLGKPEEPAKVTLSDQPEVATSTAALIGEKPKILGGETDASSATSSTGTATIPLTPLDPPVKTDESPAASSESETSAPPPAESVGGISDALLEDLGKAGSTGAVATSPQSESKTPSPMPEVPAVPTPTEKPKPAGVLSGTPLELEDKAPPHGGMLDTGELHAGLPAGKAMDSGHMLETGDDKEAKVFDTKEYHTPIAANHEVAHAKNKKWEVLIAILVILIVGAAGFVAYMMAFQSGK
ncbi:MAG TPA: hypothetical protein VLF60_02350 [Candidatus Saccharimonadales bacterium]|nr:hypothetical protein [Candidatus Saccharimonadales bacterium]